ncbi:hypothetical protein K438DRAFT_1772840 [Mycena galopus ATCC 62051]|nr:hypothetical protein K438DRAFT_1772840 [Mycena galopus ATCC 62051]
MLGSHLFLILIPEPYDNAPIATIAPPSRAISGLHSTLPADRFGPRVSSGFFCPTLPNAATAPASSVSPLDELAAVIATVSELMSEARRLSRNAQALQERLPYLLDRFQADAALLAGFKAAAGPPPPGSDTNTQVLGVPGQQYRKHKSKREALDFYKAKHEAGKVSKLEELE